RVGQQWQRHGGDAAGHGHRHVWRAAHFGYWQERAAPRPGGGRRQQRRPARPAHGRLQQQHDKRAAGRGRAPARPANNHGRNRAAGHLQQHHREQPRRGHAGRPRIGEPGAGGECRRHPQRWLQRRERAGQLYAGGGRHAGHLQSLRHQQQ
nr:hypothetical protein [Tanacetum cinerariifolium]